MKESIIHRYNTGESIVEHRHVKYLPKEPSGLNTATFFYNGWSVPENSQAFAPSFQALADISRAPVYSIDTREVVEGPRTGLITREAAAGVQFIINEGYSNITIAGQSRGAPKGLHVAAQLGEVDPTITIKGLQLINPVSLYKQRIDTLIKGVLGDVVRMQTSGEQMMKKDKNGNQSPRKIHIADYADSYSEEEKVVMFEEDTGEMVERMVKTHKVLKQRSIPNVITTLRNEAVWEQVRSAHPLYFQKLRRQTESCEKVNGVADQIKAPIIIITGEADPVSKPEKIIPATQEETRKTGKLYTMDPERRQKQLSELFPNSSYVDIVVARELGHHGLQALRPSVTRVAYAKLERYYRDVAPGKGGTIYSSTG